MRVFETKAFLMKIHDDLLIEFLVKENVKLKEQLDSNKIKEKHEIHNINNLSDSIILRKLSDRYGY